MATSPFPDPIQLWRDAVTRLEGDINSLATRSLKSQQMARSLRRIEGKLDELLPAKGQTTRPARTRSARS